MHCLERLIVIGLGLVLFLRAGSIRVLHIPVLTGWRALFAAVGTDEGQGEPGGFVVVVLRLGYAAAGILLRLPLRIGVRPA